MAGRATRYAPILWDRFKVRSPDPRPQGHERHSPHHLPPSNCHLAAGKPPTKRNGSHNLGEGVSKGVDLLSRIDSQADKAISTQEVIAHESIFIIQNSAFRLQCRVPTTVGIPTDISSCCDLPSLQNAKHSLCWLIGNSLFFGYRGEHGPTGWMKVGDSFSGNLANSQSPHKRCRWLHYQP